MTPGSFSAACLQRPDAGRAPRERPAPRIALFDAFGLWRVGRSRDLLPTLCGRAVHLDAEMPVIERHKVKAAARIREGQTDVVAEEVCFLDLPASAPTGDPEQPFAGRNQYGVGHGQPPDNAWNT